MGMKTLKDLQGFMCRNHDCRLECHKTEHKRIKSWLITKIKERRKPCKINILDKNCGHTIVTALLNNRAICNQCDSIIERYFYPNPYEEDEVVKFVKENFNIKESELNNNGGNK